MKPYIDLQGASGAVYRYKLAEDRDPRTTIAGNFVFVDATGTVVYAGEANNLHGAGNRFPEAAMKHKAEYLYTRLNVSGASRSDELQDILAALNPAMNKGE
ncbi:MULTISPECIES: hypothetical protein [Caulobacter]|uniref:GIY-YIG domain-containing protein n=1 Tax=Caulobacter rhizosphaerae TaxID=2010972 RepID=A0ABU1MT75_9CAUL|nr:MULTISPECIES: hypothetical protein [Caulobacter]KQZ32917.1 hypothetical protein ASD47_13950 [Caulobacter sp. Root1472]MDR6529398.1 hypothetical protein [Caulobacter rhizosphaerae]GGL23149.1 hypothetical protein GCM10010983_20660 [Caulobacter rhizosphaerae]HWW27309.1 hypothetical protein [Caulobacter sp.]